MKNLLLLSLLFATLFTFSCSKDEDDNDDAVATCTDGIKNQDETAVDCGGVCTACATCTDGIQNQGETGVDCGGPCGACPVCVTCTSAIVGSNPITYCEADFATQADYNNAVAAAESAGRTCN